MGDKDEFIQVKVTGLTIDPFSNMPILVLKNEAETVALPIWIGLIEASSIATVLESIQFSRPMTHDLFVEALNTFRLSLERVEIYDLSDNTFYARLVLKSGKQEAMLDARPSDAIALALRTKSVIYIAKHVVEKSRSVDMTVQVSDKQSEEQTWAEILENLSPEDFGKYKM